MLTAKALLFDMDGTLIDSRELIEGIWRRWAARHAVDAEALLAFSHGRRVSATLSQFGPPGLDHAAEAPFFAAEAQLGMQRLRAIAGAAEFLARVPAGRWALVTSADHAVAERWLPAVGLPMPPVIIGADDVSFSKPHPDGYLRAASQLGVAPQDTIVFEDSAAGIAAGRAAGAQVIAIGTLVEATERGAFWAEDFSQIRLATDAGGVMRIRMPRV